MRHTLSPLCSKRSVLTCFLPLLARRGSPHVVSSVCRPRPLTKTGEVR
jgi:hypothetical protein